jgi:YD repeat-containing protein
MSQTLSWADGRQSAQLNNIQQQTTQIFYSQATPTSLCKAELPTALNFSSITSGLICLSQTHYLQSSPASNNQATPITSLAYIDSRTGELLAKASPKEKGDPKGDVTRYQYDQLGRTRAITYHLGQTDQIKAIISYLSAGNSTNQTGYNQVIVTKPDEVKQRTLTDGLGQVVAKQVNTCPDGTSSIAGCTPGALMPDGQFRRVSSASYTNSEGVVQPQIQTSTDAFGATDCHHY